MNWSADTVIKDKSAGERSFLRKIEIDMERFKVVERQSRTRFSKLPRVGEDGKRNGGTKATTRDERIVIGVRRRVVESIGRVRGG